MASLRAIVALAALLAIPLVNAPVHADTGSGVSGLQRLQAIEEQTVGNKRERARQMTDVFDRSLQEAYTPQRLSSASDSELEALFQVANRVVFYAHEPQHAALLARTADMLETRSLLTDEHRRDVYRSWVVTRGFEQANALARVHPALQLPVLPPVPAAGDLAAGQVAVWQPADTAETLSAQIVDRDAPRRVVVLSHPRCGFSQRAIAAIEADPALSARLRAGTPQRIARPGRHTGVEPRAPRRATQLRGRHARLAAVRQLGHTGVLFHARRTRGGARHGLAEGRPCTRASSGLRSDGRVGRSLRRQG